MALQNTQFKMTENLILDAHKPYEPVARPLLFHTLNTPSLYPMPNQLYQGDSMEVMASWKEGLFDACLTDPPYNIAQKKKGLSWAFSSYTTLDSDWDRFSSKDEYYAFTYRWLSEVCRLVKKNGNIFIFGSYHNIYTIGSIANEMNLRIVNSIIWTKPNAQPNITCRMFTESTEQILWLCNNSNEKAKNWTFNYHHMKQLNQGKQMRNYWEIPLTPQKEKIHGKHPSQKPLKLMERLVIAGTHPGDLVLDCFAGSGSTLLACDRLDRRWVGLERDQDYCGIIHKRLDEERKQRRLFKEDKQD